MAKKFNEEKFRQAKLTEGYSEHDIDLAIGNLRMKENLFSRIVGSSAFPWVTAAVGAVGAGIPTGGAAVGYGGAGGYATGKTIQDWYKYNKGAYDVPENYREATNQGISNVGQGLGAGITAQFLYDIAKWSRLLTSKNAAGKTRQGLIGELPEDKATINKNDFQEKLLNSGEQNITPEYDRQYRAYVQQLNDKIYPNNSGTQVTPNNAWGEVTGQNSAKVQDIYDKLAKFQMETKAFGGNKAAEQVDVEVRGLINSNTASGNPLWQRIIYGQPDVSDLNKIMSMQNKLSPYTQQVKKGVAGGLGASIAGALGLYALKDKLKGLFGGQ